MNEDDINHEDEIFAGDKDWQEEQKIQAETEEHIHNCVNALCRILILEETNIKPDISGFETYVSLNEKYDLKYFSSTTSSLSCTVIVCYHDTADSMYYDDASLLGVIDLRSRYPATCLRREMVADKIAGLITKADIDFKEHKKFSGTFHLVSSDKDAVRSLLANKPLDLLADFPTLELFLQDVQGIYKLYDREFDEKKVADFAAVTSLLLKILS